MRTRIWVLIVVAAAVLLLTAAAFCSPRGSTKLLIVVANQLTLDVLPREATWRRPPQSSTEAVGLVSLNDQQIRQKLAHRPLRPDLVTVADVLGFDLPSSKLLPEQRTQDDEINWIVDAFDTVDVIVVDDRRYDPRNALPRRPFRLIAPVSRAVESKPYKLVIVLVSLMAPRKLLPHTMKLGDERKELTPIWISGVGDGFLTSWSTRTPGLIAVTDIKPTLESIIGKNGQTSSGGHQAYVIPVKDKWKLIHDLFERTRTVRSLLVPVLVVLGAIAAPVVTCVVILLGTKRRFSADISLLLMFAMAIPAAAPLAMLLAAHEPARPVWHLFLYGFNISWLPVGLYLKYRRSNSHRLAVPLLIIYALTSLVLLIDALTGANLCEWSIFSSYHVAGFRFYGVGNQYAAVLIVMSGIAAAAAASWNKERAGRNGVILVGLTGLVVSVVLGMGQFGANFGACLTSAATFYLITVSLAKGCFGFRHIIAGCVIGLAFALGIAFLDNAVSGDKAFHAARAIAGDGDSGVGHLAQLAMRKAAMGLGIASSAASVLVFLAFSPFLWLWMKRVQPLAREFLSDKPALSSSLKAMVVGSAIAFVTNDSGIVMVSLMIGMTMLFLLYCLWERAEIREPRVENVGATNVIPSPGGRARVRAQPDGESRSLESCSPFDRLRMMNLHHG